MLLNNHHIMNVLDHNYVSSKQHFSDVIENINIISLVLFYFLKAGISKWNKYKLFVNMRDYFKSKSEFYYFNSLQNYYYYYFNSSHPLLVEKALFWGHILNEIVLSLQIF